MSDVGQELRDLPIGDLIRSMAVAVAEAQASLDRSSIQMAEFMSGRRLLRDADTGQLLDKKGAPSEAPHFTDSRVMFGYSMKEGRRVPDRLSLMELGFTPTFYHFVDTLIEVKLALRVSKGPGGAAQVSATPVDAGYASTYGYQADLACSFKTKLVPIPPPPQFEEQVRSMGEARALESAADDLKTLTPGAPGVPASEADDGPQ